jgi:phosphohistidine phosphatase
VEERLSGGTFDPEELAAGLGDQVLLVGHEPDFSGAVQRLTGARARLKKGALAVVAEGELHLLLGPAELGAIAHG